MTYDGKPVTFHLVLVAASSPIENPLLGIRQYAWFLLAEKLQEKNVSCHLVLARNGEDMSSLIGLYDKTVGMSFQGLLTLTDRRRSDGFKEPSRRTLS